MTRPAAARLPQANQPQQLPSDNAQCLQERTQELVMPRAKGGFKTRRRHKKILKLAKGMRGARSRLFRTAREQVYRSL